MADEATVQTALQITIGDLTYNTTPISFTSDVPGTLLTISPGGFTVDTGGVDVDLSSLTLPGLVIITNNDATNFIQVGMFDFVTYYPMLEILAGEHYVYRLSRDLTEEFGTGTGTTGLPINTLRLKADTASCSVQVDAFEASP